MLSVETIIAEKLYEAQEQKAIISRFFREFQIGKALAAANFYKQKSVSFVYHGAAGRQEEKHVLSLFEFKGRRLVQASFSGCHARDHACAAADR